MSVPGEPPGIGFGWQLIQHGLPYDLDARSSLDLGEGGFRCHIAVRLASIGSDA